MTQDEAKKRWCPFARVVLYSSNEGVGAPSAGNRCVMTSNLDEALNGATKCIASDCMAWRWSSDFNQLMEHHKDRRDIDIREIADGHCGLGGPSR